MLDSAYGYGARRCSWRVILCSKVLGKKEESRPKRTGVDVDCLSPLIKSSSPNERV